MSASPTLTGTITAEALTTSSTVTLNGGTANGVAFLNGSKVLTTGSALTFDGTVLSNTQSSAASGVVANFANSTTGALLQLSSVGVANVRIGSPNADAIAFYTFGVGSYPEQMRLTSTGLGIGTSSPGYKLDVAVGTNTVSQQWQGAGTNFNLRLKSGSGATPSSSMYRLYLDYLNGTAVNSYIDFYRGSGGADGYLVFGTSGADKMTLDSSGNLGLGVTPSAGGSIYYKSFELGKAGCGLFAATASLTGSELTYVTGNAVLTYSGGPLWLYGNNGNAATYAIEDGNHLWRIAGSGTAGAAISFTQAMTLDASGNLGVGATSVTPIFGRTVKVYNAGSGGTLEVGGATVNARFFGSEGAAIAGIGTTTNTAFNFITNDTERARIDSSGGFLFRCTGLTNDAPNQSGGVFQQANGNTKIRVQSDGQAAFQFYSPTGGTSSTVGRVEVNATSTAYVTSSDYRLKEAVAPMTGALAKVAALKPCTYKWKTDGSDGEGFIAHELAEVVPDAVSGEKDAVNEDGSIKPQGIDTSFLVATLTAAIQEQQAIIESLKARLDAANL